MSTSDIRGQLQLALGSAVVLDRELGGGGMSHVFVATETALGRQIVVKVLPPDAAAALSVERFKREIQVAARLQHPHIVPLLAAGDANGIPFYTMPYVRGESLRGHVARHGTLGVNESVHILRDVASALAYAHGEGVVHRDIKPENVILSGGVAVVTDFGIAKAMDNATASDTIDASRSAMTSLGIALGTPAYMSPEQATADPTVDSRADIYAFGCVAYEMLSGASPFAGRSMHQLLAAHVTEAPEALTARNASVPPALAALVMKCLEKDPNRRPQSALALITALDSMATPGAGLDPTSMRAVKHSPLSRTGAIALGLVLLIGTAGTAIMMWNRAPSFDAYQIGPTTAIAVSPDLESDPTLSPDGKLIAYVTGGVGARRIVVRQVDGGRPTIVGADVPGLQSDPRFTPDGNRLSFVADGAIYIVPALGGTPRRLVDDGDSHAWSPDGNELAFERRDGLWVRQMATGAERQVVQNANAHSPAWSPDGRLIAYAEGLRPVMGNVSTNVVWITRREGGTPVRISDSTRTSVSPVFAADGRSLLFVSSEGGARDVNQQPIDRDGHPTGKRTLLTAGLSSFKISLSKDGTRLAYDIVRNFANIWAAPIKPDGSAAMADARQITRENQHVEAMSVSHDGKWIAFDSDRGGNFDIYKMRLDGGEPMQLTNGSPNEFHPDWSPDDRAISFHSQRDGVRHIYSMNADGSGETQITSGMTQDFNRVWSPDGRSLSFASQAVGSREFQAHVVRKVSDRAWSPPTALAPPDSAGIGAVAWSPDGAMVAYSLDGGVWATPSAGGERRLLASMADLGGTPAVGLAWHDPAKIYVATAPIGFSPTGRRDGLRMAKIAVIAMPSRRVRTIIEGDSTHRFGREDFAANATHLYFTLAAWESDVGVMALTKRRP